jgi:hypothetical protein
MFCAQYSYHCSSPVINIYTDFICLSFSLLLPCFFHFPLRLLQKLSLMHRDCHVGIITYNLRFLTCSPLVIAVNMHAQSLPQSLHIVSDSSQILDMFTVQISSCDCGEYACAELAATITYHLRFLTCSVFTTNYFL